MADVIFNSISITFLENTEFTTPDIIAKNISVTLTENQLPEPNITFKGIEAVLTEPIELNSPNIISKNVSMTTKDTEYIEDNVKVKSLTSSMKVEYNSDLLNNVQIKSFKSILKNDIKMSKETAILNSFAYLVDEYIPPPVIDSPDLSLNALKRMRYFEKYTMEDIAMHIMATIGSNGVMEEFTVDDSITNQITLSPGAYIHNGIIAEIHDPIIFSTISTPSEPYYITGKVYLSNTNPKEYISSIIVTDDPTDKVILATKETTWTGSRTINLGNMWKSFLKHSISRIHPTSTEKEGISISGELSNPYICKSTGNQYDYDNAHFSHSLMVAMIESLNNNASFKYFNSVIDNIFYDKKTMPWGVNGTFINIPNNINIGPLGIIAYGDDPITIDLGNLGVVNSISSHIVFGSKSLSYDTTSESRFNLSTDGLPGYEIQDKEGGNFISVVDLSLNSNNKYDIKASVTIPSVISKEGTWVSGTVLNIEVSKGLGFRHDNSVLLISGTDQSNDPVPAQLLSTKGNFVSTLTLEIDVSMAISHQSESLNKALIIGGLSSSGFIANYIYVINQYVLSGYTKEFLYDYYDSSSVSFKDQVYFGTGINLTSDKTDSWKLLNPNSMTIREAYNRFPVATNGLISSRLFNMATKSVHINSDGCFIFDSKFETFRSVSSYPPINESSSNPALVSPRNKSLIVNEDYMFEFNAETETFFAKPAPLLNLNSSSFTMSSDGTMVRAGGQDPSMVVSSSVSYFKEAFYAMEGWGIEWQ